jgi:hypothetical protein
VGSSGRHGSFDGSLKEGGLSGIAFGANPDPLDTIGPQALAFPINPGGRRKDDKNMVSADDMVQAAYDLLGVPYRP